MTRKDPTPAEPDAADPASPARPYIVASSQLVSAHSAEMSEPGPVHTMQGVAKA